MKSQTIFDENVWLSIRVTISRDSFAPGACHWTKLLLFFPVAHYSNRWCRPKQQIPGKFTLTSPFLFSFIRKSNLTIFMHENPKEKLFQNTNSQQVKINVPFSKNFHFPPSVLCAHAHSPIHWQVARSVLARITYNISNKFVKFMFIDSKKNNTENESFRTHIKKHQ